MSSVSGLRAYAKQCGYTHFEKSDGPFLRFYSVDACEVCGATVEGANSIKVVGKVEHAKRAGLTEMSAPDEGGHSDLHGCMTCSACNEDPNAGKMDASECSTVPCNMDAIIADHNAL